MIAVIQRVKESSVIVDNKTVGRCAQGLMILLGVAEGDCDNDADVLAKKISKLRIFSDEAGKMNLSVLDIGGEALVVSNFTLNANYRKGNRPDYLASAKPEEADRLYQLFTRTLSECGIHTETGIFGADMECRIVNDGPITLVLDSKVLLGTK